jgi:hypothetical protein
VSDFDEAAFADWKRGSGVEVDIESVSLEDIFATVARDRRGGAR